MDKVLNNKNIKQLGLSILEALVATMIVGIGFVAVFQMVNYSTQSVTTSAERTKSTFILDMIAEDLLGDKDRIHKDNKKLHENLRSSGSPINVNACKKDEKDTAWYNSKESGPGNKKAKWEHLISSDKIVRCRTKNDKRTVKVYTLCKEGCDKRNALIKDKKIYIGQVAFEMGRKRKFLYFQIDYELEP